MKILESLLQASQGGTLQQAAKQFGLGESGTRDLLAQLVPALSGGLQNNVTRSGGLENLAGALSAGNHRKYLDDAAALTSPDAVADGNGILGHLLGSKDASRALAARAAVSTGIDAGVIKRFLPLVAAAAMGAMSKQTNGGAELKSGGGLGMLSGLLDSDGDGQVMDDLLSFGKKLF